jgi:mannose-6-phosphate isomerase
VRRGTGPGAGRRLIALRNEIRRYAWGSATDIPQMLGIEPTGEPAAEMWIGAHPDSPSRALPAPGDPASPAADATGPAEADAAESGDAPTLPELIAADPRGMLGAEVLARFGPELPYLLKLLAASAPLSLQTHPTIEQAREGYAAEDAEGVPPGAAHRSYLDRNHKPELLCALTPFEALCGFRPVEEAARFLHAAAGSGAGALRGVAARLVAEGGLRDVVTWLLTLPAPEQAALAGAAHTACARLRRAPGQWREDADLIVRLAGLYPADPGVVLAMLLNHVRLAPGEAIYLAAGQIHTYIAGFGVELMASSDNVLRAGFTAKHINIPALLRTVVCEPTAARLIAPTPSAAPGELRYLSPAEDFALSRLDLAAGQSALLEGIGPSLVLCVAGQARLRIGDEALRLTPGRAAFAAAGSDLRIEGPGSAFRATAGEPAERQGGAG